MSYLNALASGGLSVGLRLYTAGLNERTTVGAAPSAAEARESACPAAPPESAGPKVKTPAPPPQTDEEMAAGRTEARARLAADGSLGQLRARAEAGDSGQATGPEDSAGDGEEQAAAASAPAGPRQLSEEEQEQVDEMERRDREVRTHEQAHVAAAAGLGGAPVYEYQTGPDGRRYAVGGHVNVKTSGSSNPDQALREAEAVKRAATAPADPSGADQAAASSASAEINRLKAEKAAGQGEAEPGRRPDDGGRAVRLNSDEEPGAANDSGPGQTGATSVYNGAAFGRQVLGAYAAAKFGPATTMARPVLARV